MEVNLLDYHSRLYDPAIGRMMMPDPHAENWMPLSPYNYTMNNPVNFVDPDGKDARISFNIDNDGNISITIQTTVNTYGKSSSKDFVKRLNGIVSKFGSKSFKQKDGTKVTVGFDISYKHHDSKKSAVEATESTPGDNILQIDDSISDKGMSNFPMYGQLGEDNSASLSGLTIGAGGREANARGSINPFFGEFKGQKKRNKLEFSAIHETFHFFGFNDKYSFGSEEGFETDVLGNGEYIYSPAYGGSNKNPAIKVNKAHYKTLGQFLIRNNPNKSTNGGTRIYQSSSTRYSGLNGVEK